MAREFFKNLPNTTTPLTAPRMNALLDGDEAMGNIVVDSIQGKNLFDKNNAVVGKLLSNGNISASTSDEQNCRCSNYIEITRGNKITISGTNVADVGCLCEYDTSLNFIDFWTTNNRTITLNANTKYVRFSISKNDLNTTQLEYGDSATDYSEYKGLGYVSGSNSNGSYMKFDDGTLMCWKDYSIYTTIENTWGALYESSTFYVGDLAIPFVGHWDFIVSQQSGPGSMLEVGWGSNGISINIASAARRTTATTYHFTVMGLGRWK